MPKYIYVPSQASPEAFPGIVYEATIDHVRGEEGLFCDHPGIMFEISRIKANILNIFSVFMINGLTK